MKYLKIRSLNLIFVSLLAFSCSHENESAKRNFKKNLMDSWAWKIFIFTDEGELAPAKPNHKIKKTNKYYSTNEIWHHYISDDLFLKKYEKVIERKVERTIFEKIKHNN